MTAAAQPVSCVGEPVSWLRLEQLALGELAAPAADAITAHLAACAACQACLDEIRADRVALPALPAAPDAPLPWWRRRWFKGVATGLALASAAAALILFLVGPPPASGPEESAELVIGTKGGDDIVVALIGERGGKTMAQPASYRPGDRFKLIVTCARANDVWYDIAVFQPAESPRDPMVASYPLRAPGRLTCGNRVAVPGAFTITGGGPAFVCLAIDEDHPPSREPLGRRKGFGCYQLIAE
jgi:hypothetical protein